MWLQAKDKKFLGQLAKDKKYLEKLVSQMNEQKDSQSTVQGNIQKEVKTIPRPNLYKGSYTKNFIPLKTSQTG